MLHKYALVIIITTTVTITIIITATITIMIIIITGITATHLYAKSILGKGLSLKIFFSGSFGL